MFNLLPRLLISFSSVKSNKTKNLYDILKISRNSSSQQIKSSYYKLAKQFHPDTHHKNQQFAQSFKQINEAYNTLKDSTKRKEYDEEHFSSSGQKNEYKFYNTQHNYGYGARKGNRNSYQSQNPFQSSFSSQNPYKQSTSGSTTNPYHNEFSKIFRTNQEYDSYVKEQHRKNIKQNKKIAIDRLKRSNTIVIIVIGLISVWIVGEITLKIYQFNSHYRIRSYPEKLDPQQLRQYEQLMRNKIRKNYS